MTQQLDVKAGIPRAGYAHPYISVISPTWGPVFLPPAIKVVGAFIVKSSFLDERQDLLWSILITKGFDSFPGSKIIKTHYAG